MKLFVKNLYVSLGRFRALYMLSALELTIMVIWSVYSGDGMIACHDTQGYYAAYDHELKLGEIGISRTPLYPLIIGITRDVLGQTISIAIVYILQSFLFLYSIKWIGTTLDNITHYKRTAYWFTAIYALYPGILSFCGIMMTESLAISLVTALLYYVSEAYFHNSHKKAAISGFICLLLWILRPSLIIIPILMILAWTFTLFNKKTKRKTAMWGFSATLISLACMGLYSIKYYNKYHKAGITCVSTWNNYMTIREANVINVDEIESPQIKIAVDSFLRTNGLNGPGVKWWFEMGYLYSNFEIADFDKFVSNQIKNHPKEIMSFLYHNRLEYMLNENTVYTGNAMPPKFSSFTRIVRVNNGTAFLIFLTGFVILIYNDIKHRRIRFFIWLLFALFATNYFTILVGAPNDFARLLAQNYPVLIAISCWLLDQLIKFATNDKSVDRIQ